MIQIRELPLKKIWSEYPKICTQKCIKVNIKTLNANMNTGCVGIGLQGVYQRYWLQETRLE